ncbi:unnamed protein product [Adineta ricciae]|uniref:Glucuronosyltransferase n=1 Tax=Adineta ricciae TaxID=249248 RepID=A0A815J367_ADIRI|nr:unnamed protein product [Adineta ricciae]
MIFIQFVFICLSTWILQSHCLNVLFVVDGAAGHLTPVLELAKAMKNHNITFLTQQLARIYTDLNSYSSPRFRVIYANDTIDGFLREKYFVEQEVINFANHSVLNALPEIVSLAGDIFSELLNKTIHVLMHERFDVIVAGQMIFGISLLCNKISTPCVIQDAVHPLSFLNLNSPNEFASLTTKEMSQFKYRIYNLAFTVHATTRIITKLVPAVYTLFQSLPQIPGPFYDAFTLKNILSSRSKQLHLISLPSSFPMSVSPTPYKKYLGAFIDETSIGDDNSTLITWIKSKPISSIVYGAFGSTSFIFYDRMYSLISGLAMFLLQTEDSFLLLAFQNANYDTYQAVLNNLPDVRYRQILKNEERVRIKQGFVKQKMILQQPTVKIFLSHCGMGSCIEGLYFRKPIICMPFNVDQFYNSRSIENFKLGQSLFIPPSRLQTMQSLGHFTTYTFTSESVSDKLMTIWTNPTYERAAEHISLEMKHAGGLKRAVEEIEFFVSLNGDLDRFTPFPDTLRFYQQYCLDLLFVAIILPLMIVRYLFLKCSKRQRKTKTD